MHHTDHIIPDQPRPLPEGPLYFVGVGGAGMSAIAQVLAERGGRVLGADPGISPAVRARLEKAGVTVFTRHDATNLGDAVAVVVSDAIPKSNPEVEAARERGLPIIRRPEALGALMAEGRGIAIAGTHGKTTTTGMVASILMAAGLDPTILIGGDLPLIGGNARAGKKGGIVLAESCEAYDGFLYLHPEIAVVLNIEADHLDYHGTEEHVFQSFQRFIRQVKPGGVAAVSRDDPPAYETVNAAIPDSGDVRFDTFGVEGASISAKDLSLDGVRPVFTLTKDHTVFSNTASVPGENAEDYEDYPNTPLARVVLGVPGRHNVHNALAAACVALHLGIAAEHIVAGLESFTGTGRRFERLGETNGVLVVDDYAHHPTEIRATLAAARSAYPDRRIVAVFQPHLYSRTRDNMDAFAEALTAADVVYLTDIYKAREEPIPGVTSEVLAERTRQAAKPGLAVHYVPDKHDLPARLAEAVRPGDIVLTLGAGDIRAAGEGLLRGM
jgi:UDP-N-acetylmuramate--alanine ligase